ncbi:hypothetical protein DXG01_013055, partial [Tephrocybe rancida]
MWPHTLEFPGEFKYAGKGILSIPKDAARLLHASLHDETRPIIFEVVDANTRKSKNIVSRFMIANLTKNLELQSSDAPVIIGAPPPPHSNHPQGRRFFANRAIDEAGLKRYRQSEGDPKGGESTSRTRLSEVFSAPPAKETKHSKRKAGKRSVEELGEEQESDVFSAPPLKETRHSKRKASKRSVEELGEEQESDVFSAPPVKETRHSNRKASKRSVEELGEELEIQGRPSKQGVPAAHSGRRRNTMEVFITTAPTIRKRILVPSTKERSKAPSHSSGLKSVAKRRRVESSIRESPPHDVTGDDPLSFERDHSLTPSHISHQRRATPSAPQPDPRHTI